MIDILKKSLTVFFLLELLGFIFVGSQLGYGTALLLLFASSAIGWTLLRKTAQYSMLAKLNAGAWRDLANGRFFLAGILFFIPGFLSDVLALCCLLPVIHRYASSWLNKKMNPSANDPVYHQAEEKRIIEGEFWREKDQ